MHCVAILHDVRSVHNVGSIFRTADGAGFEKLYLCGITPSPLDRFKKLRPDFAKVALGAEKSVAWESVGDTEKVIEKLKNEGWKILALEQAHDSILYYKRKMQSSHWSLATKSAASRRRY
jgi:tRNA G18 (ribose-2'-O)-methylase SpoU